MPKKSNNLNKQLEELEAIVEWFNQDDLDVEIAIEKFEKGAALAEDIKKQLSELKNKVSVLKQRFDE